MTKQDKHSAIWIFSIVALAILVLTFILSACNEPARPAAPAPAPGATVVAAPVGPALGADPYAPRAPVASQPYARAVIREARALMGMSAPAAMFGAQIQTESAWRPNAHSIYAAGLAQFIPATARDMERRYPLELGQGGPLNPEWSIRALVMYDRDLYRPISAATDCDRWAFTLSAYNGGPGWIPRDRALCQPEPRVPEANLDRQAAVLSALGRLRDLQ
jgi:soluble lytic murein transglycosylase-like protein